MAGPTEHDFGQHFLPKGEIGTGNQLMLTVVVQGVAPSVGEQTNFEVEEHKGRVVVGLNMWNVGGHAVEPEDQLNRVEDT